MLETAVTPVNGPWAYKGFSGSGESGCWDMADTRSGLAVSLGVGLEN